MSDKQHRFHSVRHKLVISIICNRRIFTLSTAIASDTYSVDVNNGVVTIIRFSATFSCYGDGICASLVHRNIGRHLVTWDSGSNIT